MKVNSILDKARAGKRISFEEGVYIYKNASLAQLGATANHIRNKKANPDIVTYLVDRNINYTNVCTTNCKFCNFYRPPGHKEAYILSREELNQKIIETKAIGGTRILMQGGHHPDIPLTWYTDLLQWLRQTHPEIELDCFSPSEIDNLCKVEKKDAFEILKELRDAGLRGLPGGGAELLDDEIRSKVSPKKIKGIRWLEIMGIAHELGLHTSCSMVIGFGEKIENRIKHFDLLRSRQQKSLDNFHNGFIAFIAWPLQYELVPYGKQSQNKGKLGAGSNEYLRNLAVSRIYLDNIDHFQASWPTMGFEVAEVALEFGADDFGSTMLEENVVSQASNDTHCNARIDEIQTIIRQAGYEYRQRLTDYSLTT